MHKKAGAGKKTDARIDRDHPRSRPTATTGIDRDSPGRVARHTRSSQPRSIQQLLDRGSKLRQIVKALPEQQGWSNWLNERLPDELKTHLTNVVPRGAPGAPRELVLMTDSAVWCTRLRYAVASLEEAIRARDSTITRIHVRVGR